MDITMYDCGFGDCFLLNQEKSHLLVDFGYNNKYSEILPDKTYDKILQDLLQNKPEEDYSFLLTHYHEDHFGGLDYMISNSTASKMQFKNIYIPDVWDADSCAEIVLLLQISFIRQGLSLYNFMRMILKVNGIIHLTSTDNSDIEGLYTAVWPRKDQLQGKAIGILNSIGEESEDYAEVLAGLKEVILAFRKDIKTHNQRIRDNSEDSGNYREYEIFNFGLDTLQGMTRQLQILNQKLKKKKLNDFGNGISIVFHNRCNNPKKNILFTGDAGYGTEGSRGNALINECIDEKLYQEYSVIKMPHHGTAAYYSKQLCERLSKSKSFMLISNGHIYETKSLTSLPTLAYFNYWKKNLSSITMFYSNDFGSNLKKSIHI